MNGLRQFPLGHTITGNPHSVCVSLPTAADVFGYEEKDPRVLGALATGYPRFLEHPLISRLTALVRARLGLGEGTLLLCASVAVAADVLQYAGAGRPLRGLPQGLAGVFFEATAAPAALRRAQAFLQHTGGRISSREAEATLVALGELSRPHPEDRPESKDERPLLEAFASQVGTAPENLRLTRGGMNAVHAAFRALSHLASREGRHRWVQVGWLYVDTIRILSDLCPPGVAPIVCSEAADFAALARAVRASAGEIAGIVVEAPTNPTFGLPDLRALRALADEVGAFLIVDPSLVGISNAQVLPFADVVVASQTKYAAGSGDVMAGLLAINPHSRVALELPALLERWITPLHAADRARLLAELKANEGLVARVNETLPEVARFLEAHPAVERVRWARPSPAADWLRGPGAVVSFTVRGDPRRFFDRLEMAKGPSFGTAYSLLSPYVWLAHYDLVKSVEGRDSLTRAGVPPDLMRLSVGRESPEAIIAALEAALAC